MPSRDTSRKSGSLAGLGSNGRSDNAVGRSKGAYPTMPLGFTEEDSEGMARLREAGKSAKEIAVIYGCSEDSVRRHIRKVRGHSFHLTTPAERERIELLMAQGWMPSEITRETGRAPNTIDRIRGKGNATIEAASRFVAQQHRERSRSGRTRNDRPEVVAAVLSAARRNGNLAGAAKETGFSEDKVERILLSSDLGCVVYWLWIKLGGSTHDRLVGGNTGDMVGLEQLFSERMVHFTTMVEDYGLEAVKQWRDEFCEDAMALDRIIKRMDSAISEAEQEE